MATKQWRGDAPAVAQVNTITPANVNIGNTFTVTINGKSITFTATAATVANVTAGLVALIAASTIAEFAEVEAADNTTTLTLTARTPGVPFTQTSSASGGTATNVTSTTTANSGPNNWDVAANWSPSGVPAAGDDVYIENSSSDILYGIDQSALSALNSLNIPASYTGKIGLPRTNATGGYVEYRERYLKIKSGTIKVGYGDGTGSGQIFLNPLANTTAITVTSTGSQADPNLPALCIAGSGSTYTPTVLSGSVGFAVETGQSATIDTLTVAAGTVTLGSGCTTTAVVVNDGTVALNAGVTSLTVREGTVTVFAGSITTLTIDGGTVDYRGTGTITTALVGTDGTLDFAAVPLSRTVTNCTIEASSTVNDPKSTVTWTNGILLSRCSLAEVTLNLGTNLTLAV